MWHKHRWQHFEWKSKSENHWTRFYLCFAFRSDYTQQALPNSLSKQEKWNILNAPIYTNQILYIFHNHWTMEVNMNVCGSCKKTESSHMQNGWLVALNYALKHWGKIDKIIQLPLCTRQVCPVCSHKSRQTGIRSARSLRQLLQNVSLNASFHLSGNHAEECSAKYFKQGVEGQSTKCHSQPVLASLLPSGARY